MSAVQRGVWLRFIFFIFSLGSGGHPSLASAGRPGTHRGRAAGAPARGGSIPWSRCPCLQSRPRLRASPRTLAGTNSSEASRQQNHPCGLSQPSELENSDWGTQSREPRPLRGAGAARSRSTAGAAGRRPGAEPPKGEEPLSPAATGRGSGGPSSACAQTGQRPRPECPGSAGMPDESCGVSHSHVAVPTPDGADTLVANPCSPSPSPSTSPPARLARGVRRSPAVDAAVWGRHSTVTPQPEQRGAQGTRVTTFPSGFQGSLETCLLGHGSEFLLELHKCLSSGQSKGPSLTSRIGFCRSLVAGNA